MSYPFNTFPLVNRISVVNPTASIDAKYGPWTSTAQALQTVPQGLREQGLTVGVIESGTVVEYQFKTGVENQNLEIKTLNPSVQVVNIGGSKTFTAADNFKIFHFDTTTQVLSAIFPISSLPEGFNIAIMNTGTRHLALSASNQLGAIGNKIVTRYGAAFVYKQGINLFAVGRLVQI